ncbi:hypothetical protein NHF46_09480 [Arthrobacter alpinus]|nr:hypothetical protein [Arthrobacter alpinus]
MQLGTFSVSLAAKDIKASVAFYEMPGFTHHVGDLSQNRHVMKDGDAVIGLFQGMFEKNSLTFNPGWNQDAQAAPRSRTCVSSSSSSRKPGWNFWPRQTPIPPDQPASWWSVRTEPGDRGSARLSSQPLWKDEHETDIDAIREP